MLKVRDLEKTYKISKTFGKDIHLRALRGLSFDLEKGKTLGIVGESGCGKSTLAKVLMNLEKYELGQIFFGDTNQKNLNKVSLSNIVQMVFQDPNSSLNPRKKIFDSIAEPLYVKGLKENLIVEKVLDTSSEVGLREEWLERYPHMLSGGQKQRVGIARALITGPKIIILDEPVSALDVSVQAQVLNLLKEIQKKHKTSFIFISHDLSVVNFVSDEVIVLYLGSIVEKGSTKIIFENPQHPYTQLLMKSVPKLDSNFENIEMNSELPSPINPPSGCAFRTRCPFVLEKCSKETPRLINKFNREVACFKYE